MPKGLLIVYSGPSGVGKNTVREHFASDPRLNLAYSVSMTTRPKRPLETDGVEYFFVSNAEFDRAVVKNELLEWAEFVGNKYGTPAKFVADLREQGKNVILEIEVQGALQVMERVPDCVSIFLVPPSLKELERRLRSRNTEDESRIKLRLEKAAHELAAKEKYRHVVVNDDPVRAAREITKIILDSSARQA